MLYISMKMILNMNNDFKSWNDQQLSRAYAKAKYTNINCDYYKSQKKVMRRKVFPPKPRPTSP